MEQFVRVSGIAAPLLRINVDTDQIIPARFLVRVSDEGIGEGLFADWRRRPDGTPDPAFILNRQPYDRAEILLADRNFGCGSSREGAPVALRQSGFRVVIAPSFGGIFFNNCFRNGIVPVEMPIEQIRMIATQVEETQGQGRVTVDLRTQTVIAPGGEVIAFRAPSLFREMLLEGQDEVGLTLSREPQITAFRSRDAARRPWAYRPGIA
ncbi:MAG: 3-isopropylmalate dehydratase small subunit [Alphaproteobacteria bacterium]|nr:3-isopropylmalate dehydratase small subunit [Alphaproteobacteria bacterium]